MKSVGDFVAIDVETANSDRGSICQIGVVVFSGEDVHETWQSFVKPEGQFDLRNVMVHGIGESSVRDAPSFADVIPELVRRLTDQCVVSHSAFDRVALDRAFQANDLLAPDCSWLDTAKISQRAWPQFARRGFSLANIAVHCGIEFRHHDALEDARVAGQILLKAISETGISLREWLAEHGRPTSPRRSHMGEIRLTAQTATRANEDSQTGRATSHYEGDDIPRYDLETTDWRGSVEVSSRSPNAITREELANLNLVHAGALRSVAGRCDPQVEWVEPCVLYAQIVDGYVMKFGSAAELKKRMRTNSGTINQILEFQDGRSLSRNKKITDPATYDKFKQLAPGVISRGQSIEVWATARSSRDACKDSGKRYGGQCADCIDLERTLNGRYETIQYGWAKRLS